MGTATMVNLDTLKARLIREEGLRLKPYIDTVGKITIGVGRNLTDVGITREEALTLLDHDLAVLVPLLALRCRPWFSGLDQVRQQVLADMAFNLGMAGLLGFTKMLRHVAAGEFPEAAAEGRASTWYTQVGARGDVLMTMLESGVE